MAPDLGAMSASAKHLARNPLGIIALFIILVYAFASLVVGFSDKLTPQERLPIVWFLMIFPICVLFTFAWLVSCHHAKLYSPGDYRRDSAFIEASVEQVEVAAAVRAAAARKLPDEVSPDMFEETRLAAGRVAKLVTPYALKAARSRRVLWVDDHHHENAFERDALNALGFNVVLAETTDEALSIATAGPFDVVISDMHRRGETKAAFNLLTGLRSAGIKAPFIIYSAVPAAMQAEGWKRGAIGVTNRPDDLVQLVLEAVAPQLKEAAA